MKKIIFCCFFLDLFAVSANAMDVTLRWDSVSTADGYKLYYGTSSGSPYVGVAGAEGVSPVDVGKVTTFTLSGLPLEVYFFVVTAYNAAGESGFSNEVYTDHPAVITGWSNEQ